MQNRHVPRYFTVHKENKKQKCITEQLNNKSKLVMLYAPCKRFVGRYLSIRPLCNFIQWRMVDDIYISSASYCRKIITTIKIEYNSCDQPR